MRRLLSIEESRNFMATRHMSQLVEKITDNSNQLKPVWTPSQIGTPEDRKLPTLAQTSLEIARIDQLLPGTRLKSW